MLHRTSNRNLKCYAHDFLSLLWVENLDVCRYFIIYLQHSVSTKMYMSNVETLINKNYSLTANRSYICTCSELCIHFLEVLWIYTVVLDWRLGSLHWIGNEHFKSNKRSRETFIVICLKFRIKCRFMKICTNTQLHARMHSLTHSQIHRNMWVMKLVFLHGTTEFLC